MSIESLAELLRFQSELAVDRAKQNIEQQKATAEQFTPTPAQSAYIGTIFAPGSGIADASGVFPEFPSADVPVSEYLSGEPMPSIAENIAAGGLDRYLIAPLQGLGVAGDALYAVPGAGPVLGATIGSGLKGIGALGIAARAASKGAKTEKGIATLDETKNLIKADVDEFAKDEFGFVSPTLEALIREAPPNLKGPAINDWLAANTQKGVKPKELEVLGIDEFIEANPEATLSEVVAGVAPNKVQITKTVNYQGMEPPAIDFEVSTPEFDPLDGSRLYEGLFRDIRYDIERGDDFITQQVIDAFNQSNPQAGAMTIKEVDDFLISKNESLDDFLESFAKKQYFDNPSELVEVKSVGEIDANIPNQTFAFGDPDIGYELFIGGERVTDKGNIAYSRAEAQIQLRNKLEEGGDPLRTVDEDPFDYDVIDTADPEYAQYKSYIDETLPGGSNYREVVFRYENAPEPHNVTTHFDDDRALASALIRDRKLDDGAETLHVDELQSDLHTQGSRRGYRVPDAEFNRIKQEINPLLEGTPFTLLRHAADNQPGLAFAREGDLVGFVDLQKFDTLASKGNVEDSIKYDAGRSQKVLSELGEEKFDKFVEKIRPLIGEGQIPNYPFKDDWYVMSLKQLIKDAIDEGKDAISVSGSAPIKARYTDQYSKFYESLYDQKIPSAMKKLANKYGGKFEKGKLDEYDIHGSLLDDVRKGDEFAIENLKGLYGDKFPASPMNETTDLLAELDKAAESNIIRITPEMRAKIAEEGLPSFAFGGAVETPMRFTMPEDVNIFADAQFTQPKTLTEKIASGMTDLAFGRITKDDFFRDNVVRNVLAELDVPDIVQNNLLRSEDAQNFALNTLQQAIGSPVDVTALGDDRFALDYSQRLGPGILSLAGELGKDEPSARVSYDSKDFMISPSTTARFAASLDQDRGKDFSAEVTYQPDPKTFVESQAIFGEGISPEYRLNFGRRF